MIAPERRIQPFPWRLPVHRRKAAASIRIMRKILRLRGSNATHLSFTQDTPGGGWVKRTIRAKQVWR